MNSIPKQSTSSNEALSPLSDYATDSEPNTDKDNLFEHQFDRLVLPERDLSTEESSDDNEYVQLKSQKLSRDEALR